MSKITGNDVVKAILFGVMFITTGVLVGMGKLHADVLKTFLLLVAPSPVFSFGNKDKTEGKQE